MYIYTVLHTQTKYMYQYLDLEWPLKIHSCSYFTRKPYLPIRMLFISKRHDIIRQLDEQRTTCTCIIYVPNSKCQVYIIVINDIISLVIVKFSSTSSWTFNNAKTSGTGATSLTRATIATKRLRPSLRIKYKISRQLSRVNFTQHILKLNLGLLWKKILSLLIPM